ncbi:hypothetical protein CJ030_MR8G016493 [Morella rubra]|uniref:Uncharacterized protein n=1 Tax=Morella rubra TaxID=262757 RepID=A0A6A1UU52_9ROSI|nr:hypothetical protein CJ030_MR8G016485 [Morella rubra]KAB1203348.1 hypothetical protein CJ030_MR8G016493 [Morella rubra]
MNNGCSYENGSLDVYGEPYDLDCLLFFKVDDILKNYGINQETLSIKSSRVKVPRMGYFLDLQTMMCCKWWQQMWAARIGVVLGRGVQNASNPTARFESDRLDLTGSGGVGSGFGVGYLV